MFAGRVTLHDFASRFGVARPKQRIDRLLAASHSVLAREADLLAVFPQVGTGLAAAVAGFGNGRGP